MAFSVRQMDGTNQGAKIDGLSAAPSNRVRDPDLVKMKGRGSENGVNGIVTLIK